MRTTRREAIPCPEPAAVSAAEMGRRHQQVAGLLEGIGASAAVVFGNDASRHDIRYLTAWPPGWDTFLVLARRRRPVLFVPSENHVPSAEVVAGSFVDVQWVGSDPVETVGTAIAGLLRGAGGRARVATLGPFPYDTYRRLGMRLAGAELVDIGPDFRRMRLVKSPEEIALARRAAAIADRAIAILVAELRPGMRDFEIGALVEASYRSCGADHGILFLSSAPMDGGGPRVPAQVWSARPVAEGDMVLLELSVGVAGAYSQVLRTVPLGDRVPARLVQLHALAERTFGAIVAEARAGMPARRLLEVAALVDRAGCTVIDDVVHGYGGGYLPPILRTPATQRGPVADLRLAPGMMLVVQPNVVSDGLGVQTGELVVVTDGPAERLHRLPLDLLDRSARARVGAWGSGV